jgi:hypothetical protein
VVTDVAFLTAHDGAMLADVRLTGSWPWVVVVLGAALITLGGLLLS